MSGEVLTLRQQDANREVSIRKGDRIVLRLPENPTTGFRWAGTIPSSLRLVRDENDGFGAAPGTASERVMELEATRAGRAAIDLRCARAWEQPSAADDAFHLDVTID